MCAISCRITERGTRRTRASWRLRGRYSSRKRDAAGVLHRARVVLRHVELVVLLERVGEVEGLLEELEALLGDLQQLVGVEVLDQRLAAVVAERDRAVLALVGVALLVVLAGDQRGDVRRHRLGRGKLQTGLAVAESSGSGVGALETTFQCGRRGDVKVNAAFRSGCSKVV